MISVSDIKEISGPFTFKKLADKKYSREDGPATTVRSMVYKGTEYLAE